MNEEQKLKNLKDKFKIIMGYGEEKCEKSANIAIDMIMPNPFQPRRRFETTALKELADSIKQVGIISPITVRRAPGGYELVCGERRLRAAKIAGLKKIPAVIVDISDKESAVVAITENLQRKDLNFFEEAESLQNLIEYHSLTQEEVAEKLGKSQAAVANKVRLLKLEDDVRQVVVSGELCERHARCLLRLPTASLRLAAAKRAVELHMNVTATEKMVQKMLEDEPKKKLMKSDATTFETTGRFFKNTVNKTVDLLKKSGITPSVTEKECENSIEYVIKLEKNNVSRETLSKNITVNLDEEFCQKIKTE